jgi:peptide/nickel transport system substrate-binding protein
MLLVLLLTTMTLIACSSSGGKDTAEENPDTNQSSDGNNSDNGNDENTSEPPPDPATITEFKQAPMLDGKDLPPVKDRLPEEPKLTNEMPPELLDYEIGTYGGTLRTVTSVVDWDADVFVMNNEPLLNTPGILGEEITGNVLKGYEASSDQKTFTFYMRKGLKWSDGQPVTVEDVRFTVEDVLFNEKLTPVFPAWLRSGGDANGKPFTFEVIDDYTFKISFDSPYGGFPVRLAIQGWRGYSELLKPAHYLKQFHADYTPLEQLEPLIKEAGFEPGQWDSLFHDKDITNWELTNPKAIGFPVLYPWVFVNKTPTTAEFERNPYYFKIDAAGNQLPYIDKIQSTLVQDIEMVTMKTIAGEVDFSRESAALVKMPLYKENEKNGYKALLAKMHVTPTDVFLNLTYEDETWRQVVRDLRFRKALNLAINKDEIIDSIYYGFAEPSIMQDSTYDLEEANRLLDEMGMKKGSNGIRTAPDGSKFSILFEVGAQAPDIVPLTELFVEFWRDLGLDVSMKRIDSTLWGTRLSANEIQATVIWTHTPLWYQADFGQGNWGQLWNRYVNNPNDTTNALEKPPEDVQRFYDLLRQVSVSSPEEGRQAVEQVKKEMGENLWYFVHVENVMQPLIVNEKLGNVSDKGFAIAANFSGEQFFFRK